MLNIIPIILVLLSLTGIVLLVLKYLPETQKNRDVGSLFGSGRFNGKTVWKGISAVGGFIGQSVILLAAKLKDAVMSAKSEFKHVRDVKRSPGRESRRIRQANLAKEAESSSISDVEEINKAREYFENNQLVRAEESAIEILKDDPAFLPAYELLGDVYLNRKNWLEAAEVYRYLIKKSPKNEQYWASLGDSLAGLEDYEEAVNVYKKSLAIYPKPATFISLGLAYQALMDYASACNAFESALDLEPENAQVLLLLGENYIHRQEFQAAEQAFEQVLSIEPNNHVAKERLMQLKI